MKDLFVDTFSQKFGDTEPNLSVIMPVHNEGDTVEQVLREYYRELSPDILVEFVCSEDGSTDNTKQALIRASEELPIKATLSDRRKGYSQAIRDGVRLASADYVLFVDSDGQHLPADFWKLNRYRTRFPIVSGRRIKRADGTHRKLISATFQNLAKLMFSLEGIRDITAPYRLVRADVARLITNRCTHMKESFWTEFTIHAYVKGFAIKEVTVHHRPRMSGETVVYSPLKLPEIVLSQIVALFKLREELGSELSALE